MSGKAKPGKPAVGSKGRTAKTPPLLAPRPVTKLDIPAALQDELRKYLKPGMMLMIRFEQGQEEDGEGKPICACEIPEAPAGGYSCLYADPLGNPFWYPGIAGPRRFQKLNKDDGPDLVA